MNLYHLRVYIKRTQRISAPDGDAFEDVQGEALLYDQLITLPVIQAGDASRKAIESKLRAERDDISYVYLKLL